MVRIRRLYRPLGRVLERVLSRHVSGDEEKVPQHRRPTTSICKQWAVAAVVEDVENVDNAANEPHKEPHDPVTKDVGGDS